jgi:aryl-alcohol dehydrogenase-like predicted oxidoreductase
MDARGTLRALAREGRIVLGCGRLHHLHRASERERLLRTALEGGLTRFDVAPSYGNGLAERALGEALRGARARARVNTKAGIPIRIYPALADRAFPLLRAADVLAGSSRRAYRRRDFRPAALQGSLEQSLRRLGLDAVDTFFLHEPIEPFAAAPWSEIADAMDRLVASGKARSWGIAGPQGRYGIERLEGLRGGPPPVLQEPLAEWTTRVPAAREALAYGTYAAYRAAGSPGSFEAFVRTAADAHPGAAFLVSTLDRARLGRWLAETAP